ncbi:MAG: hypothetical protein FJX76_24810, partial [Armatimonadetes bacterium]|nr:hypothetical protein [Armatimonadota bacterium]
MLGILSRRRRIVARVAVLTLAALGALYFGPLPFKEKLLMPGALSMYHRAAELQGADNCVKCHAAAQDAGAQNALCLKCHQDQLGDQPSNPHGFMPADLAAQRARLERIPSQRPFRLAVVNHLPKPHLANGQVACVTCHKEHEGTRGVDAKMD